MKFIVIVLLVLSFNVSSQFIDLDWDDEWVVGYPDIAIDGWYWNPEQAGWGLNVTIQEASFSPSGYFLFGSIYTYKEDGEPIWYTFSGNYEPHGDVYAWREGRGPLSVFEGDLLVSRGGSCPTCAYQVNSNESSGLGDIKITWSDPLNAQVEIGGVVQSVKHFYYHNGLNDNNIDFITDGAWYVDGILSNITYSPVSGLVQFKALPETDYHLFYSDEFGWQFDFDSEKTYYISLSDQLININSNSSDAWNSSLLIEYDDNNNATKLFLLDGLRPELDGFTYLGYQNNHGCFVNANFDFAFKGTFSPTSAERSVFYHDGTESDCPISLTQSQKRRVFMSLTRLPKIGNDVYEYHSYTPRF